MRARHHSRRWNAAGARCVLARRPDRRVGRYSVWPDDGLHYAVSFQMFNVFNARSDTHSVVYQLFHNPWLFGAVALSVLLQVAVIYVPLLQRAFATVPLHSSDWLTCVLIASSVLSLRELSKAVRRGFARSH